VRQRQCFACTGKWKLTSLKSVDRSRNVSEHEFAVKERSSRIHYKTVLHVDVLSAAKDNFRSSTAEICIFTNCNFIETNQKNTLRKCFYYSTGSTTVCRLYRLPHKTGRIRRFLCFEILDVKNF